MPEGNALTARLGPLPLWVWAAGGVLVVYFLMSRKSSSGASTGGGLKTSGGGGTASGGKITIMPNAVRVIVSTEGQPEPPKRGRKREEHAESAFVKRREKQAHAEFGTEKYRKLFPRTWRAKTAAEARKMRHAGKGGGHPTGGGGPLGPPKA